MAEFGVFMLVGLALCVGLVALQYSRRGVPHVKQPSPQGGEAEYSQGVEHSHLALTAMASVVRWDQVPKARSALRQSIAAGNDKAATALAMLNYWVALVSKRMAESDVDEAEAKASKRKFKDELRVLAMRGDARARCAVAAIGGELGEVRFPELYRLYLETELRPENPLDIGALETMIGIAAALGETEYAQELTTRRSRYIRRRTVI